MADGGRNNDLPCLTSSQPGESRAPGALGLQKTQSKVSATGDAGQSDAAHERALRKEEDHEHRYEHQH
jgi:hypothetical protein